MALDTAAAPPQTLETDKELDSLESDVKRMAEKILQYRETLPEQLKSTFASLLSAQRPHFPEFELGSEDGPSLDPNPPDSGGLVESSRRSLRTDEERETAEKICLLKEKISSNISAMPVALKRMKEMQAIPEIDQLEV
ncbi:hypothetical protein CFOL_v3_24506 [Cephalotus follicularis]|uniref:Uncharacterized protein n=1 Tax=Cephalotus follicularis TaxID=3775 RepID=A0A1Q3CLD2_CEPFO|nr:hypothetical protein CFOL_v3_24506 [Cephalotus follicularis]